MQGQKVLGRNYTLAPVPWEVLGRMSPLPHGVGAYDCIGCLRPTVPEEHLVTTNTGIFYRLDAPSVIQLTFKRNSKHWPQPMKMTYWSLPSFIKHLTAYGRDAGAFTPTLQCQNPLDSIGTGDSDTYSGMVAWQLLSTFQWYSKVLICCISGTCVMS